MSTSLPHHLVGLPTRNSVLIQVRTWAQRSSWSMSRTWLLGKQQMRHSPAGTRMYIGCRRAYW
eukprot:717241-Pleurochrysis_carterae.AAC.4